MNKRLAIVNHNLGSGGAEKLIYDLALELKKKKIDFSIILLTEVNCIYGKELKKNGVDVIYLSDKWDIYNPINILRLRKILKDYDVIHCHIYWAQLWCACSKIFLGKNKKFVTTEHSVKNNRREKKILKFLDKWMYSKYDEIISISTETEKSLKKWIGNYKNSEIIENGINVKKYLNAKKISRENLNLKEEDIVICQVARFNEIKNHETTIKALKELPDKYKVLFLGEGEGLEKIKYLAEKLNINNRVRFLGYRKDVENILQTSDISILTSDYEGMPISALESMVINPFIGSDVPGIRDLIEGIGILFKVKDHRDLKDKILNLMSNEKNYKEIKNKCQKKALNYDIEKVTLKYIKVYER